MCWRSGGYHTARKERKCSGCSRTIQPGEFYLENIHVPGHCSAYDYDSDVDIDCGTDGFKIALQCSRCLGLSTTTRGTVHA